MQKILSWIALLGGEVVLFVAFRTWGAGLPEDIRILDTIVSMLILALFFVDLLIPWVDWNGGCHSRLGSLGLRWTFTCLYAVAAVVVMVLCPWVFEATFLTQLLIQIVLFLGLILGFSAVSGALSRIEEVYAREERLRDRTREMMRNVRHLEQVAAEVVNLPESYRTRIAQLVEEVRFIAPCASAEALDLEKRFADALRTVEFALSACDMNRETIETALAQAERICIQRKTIYID